VSQTSNRSSLLTTAEGETSGAFGPKEWSLVLGISCIWGGSFVFIANALDSFPPPVISLMRLSLGFLALSCFPAARNAKFEKGDMRRAALLGIVWLALPFLLFPIAEQWISSAVAGMLNGGIPVIAAIISAVMLHRSPGPRQILGIAVGAVGIVFISLPSLTGGSKTALGVALVLVAVLGYGIASNLAVPLTQRYGSLATQWRVQGFAVLWSLPFGLSRVSKVHDVTFKSLGSVLVLGLFGTGIALVLAGRLMARVGVTRGTVFNYLVPVVAIVLGVVFRDDKFEVLHGIGIALVLSGAFVLSRAGR
jgi:drug/metabolite transporter (DMT)-like permease